MKTSQIGIDLIKELEGFRSKMYRDVAELPTIGYGTLIDEPSESYLMTSEITPEQAETLLRQEIDTRIDPRLGLLIKRPISQNQWDSLCSFCYNTGTTALQRSTLLAKINNNPNDTSIRHEFLRWSYADHQQINGLLRRRSKEVELYFKPTI